MVTACSLPSSGAPCRTKHSHSVRARHSVLVSSEPNHSDGAFEPAMVFMSVEASLIVTFFMVSSSECKVSSSLIRLTLRGTGTRRNPLATSSAAAGFWLPDWPRVLLLVRTLFSRETAHRQKPCFHCLLVPRIRSCWLRYHAGFHPPVGFVAWARDGSVSVSGARVGHCCARGVEPPTASLAYQARVYRGCPAGTHPCDTPSRVMVCQSANSVRVAFRVVRVVLCWCHLAEKLCRQVLSHSHHDENPA